jgi:hypothetical protein
LNEIPVFLQIHIGISRGTRRVPRKWAHLEAFNLKKIMKKFLIIKTVDGGEIKRDITLDKIAPIGAPANAPEYGLLCAQIAQTGCNHEWSNETHFILIAPSQIKTVEVKFEK